MTDITNTDYSREADAYTVNIPVNPAIHQSFGNALSEMIEAAKPTPEYIGSDKGKLYSNDDPEFRKPRDGYTVEVYVLDLSKKEELDKYTTLLNKAGTSLFTKIRYIERHWIESTQNWKIFIELTKKVLVDPDTR